MSLYSPGLACILITLDTVTDLQLGWTPFHLGRTKQCRTESPVVSSLCWTISQMGRYFKACKM